jgi:hypothetical protein
MRPRALLIADLTAAALFAASAGLQLNDPDPGRWVAIYLAAAAAAAFASTRPIARLAAGSVAIIALGWAMWIALRIDHWVGWRGLGRPMEKVLGGPVELTREVLGLAIVAAYMGFVALRKRRASLGRWSRESPRP